MKNTGSGTIVLSPIEARGVFEGSQLLSRLNDGQLPAGAIAYWSLADTTNSFVNKAYQDWSGDDDTKTFHDFLAEEADLVAVPELTVSQDWQMRRALYEARPPASDTPDTEKWTPEDDRMVALLVQGHENVFDLEVLRAMRTAGGSRPTPTPAA